MLPCLQDLADWIPEYCSEAVPYSEDDASETADEDGLKGLAKLVQKAQQKKPKKKRNMSMFIWGAAYDQWALAAAALGQLTYSAAKTHYANSVWIAGVCVCVMC